MVTINPTLTELEAINGLLLMTKDAPVATIDEASTFDQARIAKEILQSETLSVLMEGWSVNYLQYTAPSDSNNEIPLPVNTIFARSYDPAYNFSMRPKEDTDMPYLYDNDNETFTFTSSRRIEIYKFIDWLNIPMPLRMLIYKTACASYERRVKGNPNVPRWITDEISKARRSCESMEIKGKRPTIFDNYRHATFVSNKFNPIGGNIRQ